MANSTPFVRKDIWSLESTANPFDPITLAYAKAVAVMQSRPKTDPTSWSYQAAVHGINTSVFGPPPSGATWNQCKHGSWYFLPWHRMFVYYFERIVRKAVLDAGGPQDFALPYWNYNSAFPGNTLPIAFRTPTLPDGSPNPLFLAAPMRNAPVMQGGQFPTQYTNHDDAFRSTAFGAVSGAANAFGGYEVRPVQFSRSPHGLLESTPHDAIHVLVGGQGDPSGQCGFALMTDPDCAANDPIFWLHHANIDRLWNDWTQQGGGRLNPTDNTWLNQSFVFHDENGARVTMTCSQVLDTANQLSYVYDDAPAPVSSGGVPHAQMVIPPTQPPSGPPELMGASETPLPLTGSSATVALNMPQSTQAVFASALTTRPRRLFVSVDDIEAEVAPGFPYAVYLVCGNGDREHIGNVSLFGLRAMKDPAREHDDGDPGFRHVFEVTAAVAALRARGSFNPNEVSVTFEPVTMQPPPGQQATPEMLDTSHPVVRIGRVSLFAA